MKSSSTEQTPLLRDVVTDSSAHAPPKAHPPARKSTAQGGRYVALPKGSTVAKKAAEAAIKEEKVEKVVKGRVTVYCTAGAYDKRKLRTHLERKLQNLGLPQPQFHQDALYVSLEGLTVVPDDELAHEVFYFDYGVLGDMIMMKLLPDTVVVMWGMTTRMEEDIVRELEAFEVGKLEGDDVDIDEFEFVVDNESEPRMVDDVITLNDRQDYRLRLAISYALSQSVKLSVFEESIEKTIDKYKSVPYTLARTGEVHMHRTDIAKAIGHIFMQMSAVNLVSNVLDTPDFFWEEPDYLERLYRAIRGYLEISRRTEVLNKRLEVCQAMMNILKDEQHQLHGEKLEWIVIWLIVVEIVIGIVGIVSTLWIHFKEKH